MAKSHLIYKVKKNGGHFMTTEEIQREITGMHYKKRFTPFQRYWASRLLEPDVYWLTVALWQYADEQRIEERYENYWYDFGQNLLPDNDYLEE